MACRKAHGGVTMNPANDSYGGQVLDPALLRRRS
jgi:hypothetical protein